MLAQRVCRRDPLPRRLERICGRGPRLAMGRSPHLAEARSGFWKGERASEGRGCFERGTLNADREANRKGAALFNGLPSWRELQKPAQKLEESSLTTQQGRTTKAMNHRSLSLDPSPRLVHGSPDVGSSLGRAGIAGKIVVFKGTFDPVLGHAICISGDTESDVSGGGPVLVLG